MFMIILKYLCIKSLMWIITRVITKNDNKIAASGGLRRDRDDILEMPKHERTLYLQTFSVIGLFLPIVYTMNRIQRFCSIYLRYGFF